MKPLRICLLSLSVLALLTSLSAAADGKKKGKGQNKSGPATEIVVSASFSFTFGNTETRLIQEWFRNPRNLEGLPPGLARSGSLPPGLEKQLVRNGSLPPGLQKKAHPLPNDLRSRLPQPPDGVQIVIVAGRVLAVHVQSSKILDLVADLTISLCGPWAN